MLGLAHCATRNHPSVPFRQSLWTEAKTRCRHPPQESTGSTYYRLKYETRLTRPVSVKAPRGRVLGIRAINRDVRDLGSLRLTETTRGLESRFSNSQDVSQVVSRIVRDNRGGGGKQEIT